MSFRSTDAEARATLSYATDATGKIVVMAWTLTDEIWYYPLLAKWRGRGWTVAHVHRDQSAPILAAFEAQKKGQTK